MEADKLKVAVLHSLKWVVAGKVLTQVFRWVMTFWVIRLLTPEDYGLVAMADVLLSFLMLIVGALFSPAIVQSKHIDNLTLSRLFGGVLLVHSSVFLLQYFSADLVASYYNADAVADILKVNAWCFLILAFNVIPQALLTRQMQFKKISIISALSNITAAVTTLLMALNDYGYWSIVIGEVLSITLKTILVIAVNPVLLFPRFDLSAASEYLKFGGIVVVHGIIFYIFTHVDVFIAGRYLSAAEVGLFALSLQFALMPQKKLLPLLKQIAFPAFSKIQDNTSKLAWYVEKVQRLSFTLTIPIFWGLASVVDLAIPIILGEKWIDAIYPCIIILFMMPLRFSDELFFPALKSQRKVGHLIVNTLIATTALTISLLLLVGYGALGLALAWLVSFPCVYTINVTRNCNALNVSLKAVGVCLIKPIVCGGVMVATIFSMKLVIGNVSICNMFLQIGIGALTYVLTSFLFNRKSLKELIFLFKR
ncbi:lipopolysaccharide biosynthesis protein [Alteromonas halophila]|uniref:Lipopolysaccharide biosynthesis protein n=1 Tax=Alteromonas halophila TaxID=516698 RepID=A0A918JL45_9ALTE|nr:lipopolysaccharide biosynthesis protein [Alteromonas halophila]GGW86991.1 hypothetical protein GCM10007391_20990 [Alteromonas halophila]